MNKRRLYLLIVALCALLLTGCTNVNAITVRPDEYQIQSICELATLECYYNNLAKNNKEAERLLQKNRKFWIDYSGIVKIGVDMSQVKMELDGNNLTITLPQAKVLEVSVDNESYSNDSMITSNNGIISNTISPDDQNKAIGEANEEMRKSTENNAGLLLNARNRAKTLIEQYVNSIGELTGETYTITWKYPEAVNNVATAQETVSPEETDT